MTQDEARANYQQALWNWRQVEDNDPRIDELTRVLDEAYAQLQTAIIEAQYQDVSATAHTAAHARAKRNN
jgi:hypothetical protein